ncbi:MAG: GH3 auxin-responsive promoter family protein [Candidatus Sericytochromatia bacterium]|nr:GH3 auxin-responsive promoter family protein [Candidatus Sericytochromatia bacterium]
MLVRSFLRLREARHVQRFEAAIRDPEAAQFWLLRRLWEQNRETAFGFEHGFGSLRTLDDWRRAVPIREYEAHRPWIRRLLAGERKVLTAEEPDSFCVTSGSTGEPKLVPVSPRWREGNAALTRLWIRGAVRDHPRCVGGRILTLVSPAVEGVTERGLPFGSMSGMLARRAPWLTRRQYAVPYSVALVREHEARYFMTARVAMAQPVTALLSPNPSTLHRLAGVIADRADDLLRALHDGGPGTAWPDVLELEGPVNLPEKLADLLSPRPDLARKIGAMAEKFGRLLPSHLWPDLALVGCWLGGSAGVQARGLPEVYGRAVPFRDLGLLASEGRMTMPLEDGQPAGVLLVHAVHYEFLSDAEDRETGEGETLLAHQLEVGGRYRIIITAGQGLYRYDMNDIVEVRGFVGRTPKVAFLRKGRDVVSLTGEKLHLNQVQEAVLEAATAAGLAWWQYRLLADVARMAYDLLVEPTDRPWPKDAAGRLAAGLDNALAARNLEYASKRSSGRLGPPRIVVMRRGWAEAFSRAAFAAGRREAQYKWNPLGDSWDEVSLAHVEND